MTEIPISPNIWKLAAAILTQKQLTVLELREKHGYSWNQLAITLDTTRATVREHHRAATRKILNELELRERELHAKQQRDHMDEMERIEQEVFPDSRPRSEVVVRIEPRPDSESDEKKEIA